MTAGLMAVDPFDYSTEDFFDAITYGAAIYFQFADAADVSLFI